MDKSVLIVYSGTANTQRLYADGVSVIDILDHLSPCADPDGRTGGPDPPPSPGKLQKYRVPWQYWSGSP